MFAALIVFASFGNDLFLGGLVLIVLFCLAMAAGS
jgi:hypothetical protein